MKAHKIHREKAGESTVARRQDKWLSLKPYYIIQLFNAVVKGLVEFDSGSDRLMNLYPILYTLRRFAALTLAHHNKNLQRTGFLKCGGQT
jgi:hypothetical protein